MEKSEKRVGLSKTGFILSALAVLILIAIIAALILLKPGIMKSREAKDTMQLASPVYPEMNPYPDETSKDFDAEFDAWSESVMAQRRDLDFSPEIEGFFRETMTAFLKNGDSENHIVSPLNLYIGLSMLAETTDGESRQEILDALNCPDMDTLRSRASDIWNAHYRKDGATNIILANSLWLNDSINYNVPALQYLADNYHASSFSGKMGSEDYNALLRNWINGQTDGLLSDEAGSEGFNEQTVMALVSSICYRAKWSDSFRPENTASGVFHAPSGDIDIDFMHTSGSDTYYWGENFGAIKLPLANGGGSMYLLLPDEGHSVDELLSSSDAIDFIFSGSTWENSKYLIVNTALPKFDVEASVKLKDGLSEMGISTVFSSSADFSPICDTEGVFLSEANHAARVTVDEEGVSAAAYTLMSAAGAGMPPEEEIDFTLDRPFIFVINSDNGMPLFAGVVNQP